MNLKALLIDIDGTLMFQGAALPGANETLARARALGLAVHLLTNISARLPAGIGQELRDLGIEADDRHIHTAATACRRHVGSHPGATCHLLVPPAMEALFEGLPRDSEAPDFVVIGDVGERFDYASLNHVFRLLRQGARLVVPHKNLYWHDATGPRLDAGAFVLGLEAASGQQATVTGKPDPAFFQSVLDAAGVTADEALVIGDDLRTDIAGAHGLGMPSVLVRTGKGRDAAPGVDVRPDHDIPDTRRPLDPPGDRGLIPRAHPMEAPR